MHNVSIVNFVQDSDLISGRIPCYSEFAEGSSATIHTFLRGRAAHSARNVPDTGIRTFGCGTLRAFCPIIISHNEIF